MPLISVLGIQIVRVGLSHVVAAARNGRSARGPRDEAPSDVVSAREVVTLPAEKARWND